MRALDHRFRRPPQESRYPGDVGMLHIDMSVDGSVIEMRLAEIVELSLAESPATGFRWNLRAGGAPILALVADSLRPAE